MKYLAPRWVEEKMEVIAPFQGSTGVKCSVIVATGKHARVVNAKRNIDRWYPLTDLRVPEGDPHA